MNNINLELIVILVDLTPYTPKLIQSVLKNAALITKRGRLFQFI